MKFLGALWRRLADALMAFGHGVSKYLLTPALYFLLGALFTLPARLGDALHLKPLVGSPWRRRLPHGSATLEQARKLF